VIGTTVGVMINLIPCRINLRTKRYRKCLLVPVYGIFCTVWYVSLFDSVVSSEKDLAPKTHCYDAFREWWWTELLQGYLRALGMSRTAQVKRDARMGEAEARRDAGIRVSHSILRPAVRESVWCCWLLCVLFFLLSINPLMRTNVPVS